AQPAKKEGPKIDCCSQRQVAQVRRADVIPDGGGIDVSSENEEDEYSGAEAEARERFPVPQALPKRYFLSLRPGRLAERSRHVPAIWPGRDALAASISRRNNHCRCLPVVPCAPDWRCRVRPFV